MRWRPGQQAMQQIDEDHPMHIEGIRKIDDCGRV